MTAERQDGQEFVSVDIYDQQYHLAGTDLERVRRLAARVDEQMRAVSAQGRTVDSLRVAVLAALNLADALMRAEERLTNLSADAPTEATVSADALRERARRLSGILDSVLDSASGF